jgi:hypothetical protein
MARKQFLLRIDPELWKELEKWAADDLRSVNGQVEWLLRDAVRLRKGGNRRSAGAAGDEVDEEAGDVQPGAARPQRDAAESLAKRRS